MIVYLIALVTSIFFAELYEISLASSSVRFQIKLPRCATKYRPNLSLLFLVLSSIPFSFISSIRFQVGTDYEAYQHIFLKISAGDRTYVEPGYYMLNKIIAALGGNAQIVFAICGTLTTVVVICELRHYIDLRLGILFFFLTGCYFFSFNGIRQALAAAFCFWALRYWISGQYGRWGILFLLAVLFHKTALLYLMIYIIFKFKINYIWIIFAVVLSAVFLFFRTELLQLLLQIYPDYRDSEFIKLNLGKRDLILCSFYCLLILCFHKNFEKTNIDKSVINVLLFYVVSICFYWWVPELNRLTYYFSFYKMIFYSRIHDNVKNSKTRYFVLLILIFIEGVHFSFQYLYSNFSNVLPYHTIF